MTKQEEIIRTPEQKEAHKVYRASLKRDEIEKEIGRIIYGTDEPLRKVSNILAYLHSQGVVIRVERELPTFYTSKMPTCEKGLECSFIEPLIKAKDAKDKG